MEHVTCAGIFVSTKWMQKYVRAVRMSLGAPRLAVSDPVALFFPQVHLAPSSECSCSSSEMSP